MSRHVKTCPDMSRLVDCICNIFDFKYNSLWLHILTHPTQFRALKYGLFIRAYIKFVPSIFTIGGKATTTPPLLLCINYVTTYYNTQPKNGQKKFQKVADFLFKKSLFSSKSNCFEVWLWLKRASTKKLSLFKLKLPLLEW